MCLGYTLLYCVGSVIVEPVCVYWSLKGLIQYSALQGDVVGEVVCLLKPTKSHAA